MSRLGKWPRKALNRSSIIASATCLARTSLDNSISANISEQSFALVSQLPELLSQITTGVAQGGQGVEAINYVLEVQDFNSQLFMRGPT